MGDYFLLIFDDVMLFAEIYQVFERFSNIAQWDINCFYELYVKSSLI